MISVEVVLGRFGIQNGGVVTSKDDARPICSLTSGLSSADASPTTNNLQLSSTLASRLSQFSANLRLQVSFLSIDDHILLALLTDPTALLMP